MLAPMAGGPTTAALVAAVLEAGAFGFLAAGYRTADEVAAGIAELRGLTGRPFGLNLFVPTADDAEPSAIAAYAARIGANAADACWSDDGWDAKLELALREQPSVVSFTFGCPAPDVVAALGAAGVATWCTVTSPAEARAADAAGVDALVVQGGEAGGHQSAWDDLDGEPAPLLELLRQVRDVTRLPLVGAGGVGEAADVAAVLDAGAEAAQVGTAFLLAPEAGTSEPHRRALAGDAPTVLTRAFSGRRARGIVNGFMRRHDAFAPHGYPQVHYLTTPLRAASRAAGDADGINLWAGTAYARARAEPAAEIVRRLTP